MRPKPEPELPPPAERRVIPGLHFADGRINYEAVRALVAYAKAKGWVRPTGDDRPWHAWGWQ